jgi:solute carrier family 35 protein E3
MANEAGLLKMIMQSLHSPPAVSYVVLSLLVNLMSAVGLIQLNKYIYLNYAFPNMALTCLHFVVTFVGLFLTYRLGSRQFSVKRVPIGKMLPMAVSSCLSVVLTNYSLQYNSVGTYQCFKTFNTPGVVIISYYFYKKHYSTRVILTIVSCRNYSLTHHC